jgi:hypothetical protein
MFPATKIEGPFDDAFESRHRLRRVALLDVAIDPIQIMPDSGLVD